MIIILSIVIPVICLLICLIFAGKDIIENYENKLRGINKKNSSISKYIFGAIYVVITGIAIFNIINNDIGTSGCASLGEQVFIENFNSKFLQYEGTKSGTQVRALINQVKASNAVDENEDIQIQINSADVSNATGSKIKNTSKYTIRS